MPPRSRREADRLVERIRAEAKAASTAVAEGEALARLWQEDIARRLEEALGAVGRDHRQELEATEAVLKKISNAGLSVASWDDPRWRDHGSAVSPPEVVRFGRLTFAGKSSALHTPAVLPFPGARGLVFKVEASAKDRAIEAVQALLLRLAALVPPGKLRMLLVDPIGLGENVAPFMHLNDYVPELVTGKAWAERHDIERRLADLSAHMEMVIQTYLRGAYTSIEEYNRAAEEVAEAYRVLAVIGFPVNFSEEAATRLLTILTNGPRCGVLTIMTVDTDRPLPHGFSLSDLERESTVITYDGTRFVWQDPDFGPALLELDRPPAYEQCERLIRQVGGAAKSAERVEVPFEKISAPREEWWTESAATGLSVPIGRAGARKIQYLELGEGTAQHVLVAGRTGSGKSNLLHVVITGLALMYDPAEVELYLIDFKRGVEFKPYALEALPHARVIAIESEREFGLSVLEGLDAELRRRGDAFRDSGVNGLEEFRARTGEGLPRILLLVDEFQEFFTDDDVLARRCALLLDRLARQGRAFGIHVLLGSQTLAGAYSLGRSTMDQMAVRIALQCSEADSDLILSRGNPAARLLSRPGDAFYNSANGLKEGNTRFQIAWLEDAVHTRCLQEVRALSASRQMKLRDPVIFDGNAAPRLEDRADHPIQTLLAAPSWPDAPPVAVAWLGEPVAIKEPSAASFARREGRHLLILGRDEQSTLGILSCVFLSLGAQYRPDDVVFYIADSTAPGVEGEGFASVFDSALPHEVHVVQPRRVGDLVAQLAETVTQRHNDPAGPVRSLYLGLVGLQGFRTLRRDEDFVVRRRDAAPTPAEDLATILRDGPRVGVHVIASANTFSALSAIFDRRAVREFAIRVALAMNERESNDFIDSSVAAKLGPYRGLLVDDELAGAVEKFRPYAVPSKHWLLSISEGLRSRSLG